MMRTNIIFLYHRKYREYADTVDINVDKSSQFLSALLISAMVMEKNFTINVTGTHGMAYVEMTRLMMKQFGLDVMQDKRITALLSLRKRRMKA